MKFNSPFPLFIALSFFLHGICAAQASPEHDNGKLIEETKCSSCHAKKTAFGDANMIYSRTDHKVISYSKLKSMVSRCNAELRLDLFPEDEADVSNFLNTEFYKFKP